MLLRRHRVKKDKADEEKVKEGQEIKSEEEKKGKSNKQKGK